MNIPEIEKQILEFWKKDKTFEKSLNKKGKDYVFYDGPPFATGLPHYGHIVASLMKDMVPRFWTMRGYHVERKWGWDTHGLPIENIVEQELGLKNKKDIEKIGVDKFNETARSKVLMFVDEWKKVIERMGRWADMENPYKTMDLEYMESVWWVFKELWDKELIYEGYKSMHVCPRCETTLSQHEVSDNYHDVKDLSVTVKLELVGEPGTYILAWTTTPWTLIGNVALAIGEKLNYIKVKFNNEFYILVEQNIDKIFNGKKYEIIEKINSKELIGKKYKPLFDYYVDNNLPNKETLYTIVSADFVTTEDGTGVVHIAPAFGEEDMNLGKEKNLSFIQHVKMNGQIAEEAKEFAGLEVKPKDDPTSTDKKIIEYLEKKNLLFSQEEYLHSYPYCYRCDSPLLNYATSSLFVKVSELKNKALKHAENINWTPKHIKEGRFGNWLEGARDWSISRQRFWGSVIPIWVCDKCKEKKVIGSIAELEKLSGAKITDLHKHFIDKIEFDCSCAHANAGQGSTMKRIPDVLDCWFESGSMPYAQMHYPFENKEKFEKNFPAKFIAEGVDQTRAWFYYLHILSTALKNSEAFENVIVNGMVLAEDGKKMSKHLNNYPDPMDVFEKYGADAARYYLATSPVMKADDLCFSEKGVDEVVKKVSLMILNILNFYKLFSSPAQDGSASGGKNILDKWILSKTESLKKEITDGYENYDLNKATKPIAGFIDELSTWYVRRSRERFKNDDKEAMQTLRYVLLEFSKIIAPIMPFIADYLYQELGNSASVHLADWPEVNKKLIDEKLEEQMEQTRNICSLGLQKRAETGIKVRQPLAKLKVKSQKLKIDELTDLIKDEVNVKEIEFDIKLNNDVELDTNISEELREEGLVRDFVRSIQAKRKEMGLTPKDRIRVIYSDLSRPEGAENFREIISKYADQIKKQVIAEEIIFGDEFKIEKI